MAYGVMLQCNKCGESKPTLAFFKESKGSRGYRYSCKSCEAPRYQKYKQENKEKVNLAVRRWVRKTKYFFPENLYEQRLAEQGNACAICGSKTAGGKGTFHADHNHETKTPRGVLCHNCNVALGNFQDDPNILAAAIEYLNKYSEVK